MFYRDVNSIDHSERVENLARHGVFFYDDRGDVPSSWSLIGLESMQWPRGHPVGGGVLLMHRPSLCPSQRARSWSSGAEMQPAPNAAFNISDGVETIGYALVAKLTHHGISLIDTHASARGVGCRANKIQWAGTLQ